MTTAAISTSPAAQSLPVQEVSAAPPWTVTIDQTGEMDEPGTDDIAGMPTPPVEQKPARAPIVIPPMSSAPQVLPAPAPVTVKPLPPPPVMPLTTAALPVAPEPTTPAAPPPLTTDEFVRQYTKVVAEMIKASKAEYRRDGGHCACPDDVHLDGRPCGERSGYYGPKHSQPLCYPSDVTPDMVTDYELTGSITFAAR